MIFRSGGITKCNFWWSMKTYIFVVLAISFPVLVSAEGSNVKSSSLNELINDCVGREKYSREMNQIAIADVLSSIKKPPADRRSDEDIEAYCKVDAPEKEKIRIKADIEREERKRIQDEFDAKNILIQKKENIFAEAERLKKASLEEQRAHDLKNRKIEPSTIDEAKVFYNAADGGDIVMRPPIVEDNGKYAIRGVIENLLDGVLVFNGGSSANPIYFFATIDGGTKYTSGFSPRVNSAAQLIGEFIGLKNYTTVSGQSKIAPVFKVVMMGK